MTIPYLEMHQGLNNLRDKHPLRFVFTQISIMTYTIYLLHYELFSRIITTYPGEPDWYWQVPVAFSVTIVLSVIVYRLYEKPMTDLRDRFSFSRKKK
ncbi:MAG: hypothetical protein AAF570_23940 [Bacteroidota bacterium]